MAEYWTCRGIKVPNDPVVVGARTRRLLRTDAYEQKEAEAVLSQVRGGDTVLEIGAGLGFMSSLLAARCGAARVVSYEANPRMIPFVRRTHAANGVSDRCEVRHALLAPGGGPPLPFYVREEFDASSLDPDRPETIPVIAVEDVPRADADEAFAEIRPDVLVCDIEGAEAQLLPALPLRGLRLAVVELHPQWIGREGVAAVFGAMAAAGLTYFPRASQAKVVVFRGGDW
ncbi:MAG: FkbM family methyltransferase [Hasllibacter sp.]